MITGRDYFSQLFFFLVDEIFRIRVEKFLASFKLITFVKTSGSRNFSYIFSPFFLGSLWNFYREKFDEMFMEAAVYRDERFLENSLEFHLQKV